MRALGIGVVAFHLVKVAGLINNARAFPSLIAGDQAPDRPRTSILLPARNEAARLPQALRGLLAQPADEIFVLDDGSTDATAEVVTDLAAQFHDSRLRLIPGRPCPPGWSGKNWACHQLAAIATGDLLVFCDADVTFAPGALDAAWAAMQAQSADLFSVFPRQRTGTLGERLLVPLLDENLLAFLPHQLLSAPAPSAAAANGQFLAFRRSAYIAVGGHPAVAPAINEDLAFARRIRRLGLRLGLALGGEEISARMYDDYRTTVRGLGKSLRTVHGNSDVALVATAALSLTAYTLPWLRWRDGWAWPTAAILGLAERVLVNAKTGRRGYAEAALVPITALAALPVYAVALRRTARWKGRIYP
jgi:hypothetical protein